MDKKMDLRARTTIRLLTGALFELMQHKPFEDISVTDICRAAEVNRSTFYNRFEDKQQLLRQLLLEMQHTFETRCAQAVAEETDARRRYLSLFEQIVRDIEAHRAFYQNGILSDGDYVQRIFRESMVAYLIRGFERDQASGEAHFSVPVPVIAEFFAGAFLALAGWWVKDGQQTPIGTLMEYADRLSCGHVSVCPPGMLPNQ
ncbi:MAG: TetR/AcrR family transcriptional regulator [Butyricicoccus sp.]